MAACASCGESHPDGAQHCPTTGDPVTQGPCGTQIDRYAVERLLGGGGMGAVYRGRHVLLGQPVAVKLLRTRVADNPEVVSRFQREAQAAAAIGNPHIVRVSDFGETALGQPFLVMELLEGADLEHLIARRGPLPIDHAVGVALQILDGLGAAHGAGIIHRDLKPGNVFLTHAPGDPTGPRDFVKIVDFGISKVTTEAGHSLTKTGMVLGTPYYMAPEQARGTREQDQRVDLYAAAVILYQMLARALPFDGESYEELVIRICTEPPRPLGQLAPHVPQAIVAVVERGMARDPKDRWPTAAGFADVLRAAAGRAVSPAASMGASTPPPLETGSPTPPPNVPRSPALVAPPAVTPPAAPAPSSTSSRPTPSAPSRTAGLQVRRSWLLPGALAFLGIAILAAAGVAAWIATRGADTGIVAPTAGAPFVPAPSPTGVALVPITGAAPSPPPPTKAPDVDDDDWGIPSAEEIAQLTEEANRLGEQASASIPVPPAPEPTRGVAVGEPYIVGDYTSREVVRLLSRAPAQLERCRRPDGLARVRVQAMVAPMTAPMVTASGSNPDQCGCVANCIRDALTGLGGAMAGGIIYVEIALAPR
jgi:serine/threonine-protein kinase